MNTVQQGSTTVVQTSGRRSVAAQSCAGSPPCHTMAYSFCLTLQVDQRSRTNFNLTYINVVFCHSSTDHLRKLQTITPFSKVGIFDQQSQLGRRIFRVRLDQFDSESTCGVLQKEILVILSDCVYVAHTVAEISFVNGNLQNIYQKMIS